MRSGKDARRRPGPRGADVREQRSRDRQHARARAMARPKKQPAERRVASVRSDLTIAEKTYVQEQADKAGLSEAEYTRRRVLGFAVTTPARGGRTDPALVSEINRLGNQLSALGNLANQVALYLHTDRRIPPEWDALPGEIKAARKQVEQTLDKVLYDDGP